MIKTTIILYVLMLSSFTTIEATIEPEVIARIDYTLTLLMQDGSTKVIPYRGTNNMAFHDQWLCNPECERVVLAWNPLTNTKADLVAKGVEDILNVKR